MPDGYTSDEDFANQRLAKMVAHQKMMQQQRSVAKPSLSPEPTVDVHASQEHPMMNTAYSAKGSNENPFEKNDPNHRKWFDSYMQWNMRH